jgi:hypothetical protein
VHLLFLWPLRQEFSGPTVIEISHGMMDTRLSGARIWQFSPRPAQSMGMNGPFSPASRHAACSASSKTCSGCNPDHKVIPGCEIGRLRLHGVCTDGYPTGNRPIGAEEDRRMKARHRRRAAHEPGRFFRSVWFFRRNRLDARFASAVRAGPGNSTI